MPETKVSIPPKVYAVTLGCEDVTAQRSFYESWGWQAAPYSSHEYVAFNVDGLMLAFYPTPELAKEAAPGEQGPAAGRWKGVTLAVNLPAKDDVDRVWRDAVAAGARAIGEPEDRPWGGRSGYIADPEGNRWEIIWVPAALLGA